MSPHSGQANLGKMLRARYAQRHFPPSKIKLESKERKQESKKGKHAEQQQKTEKMTRLLFLFVGAYQPHLKIYAEVERSLLQSCTGQNKTSSKDNRAYIDAHYQQENNNSVLPSYSN